ncbi:aldehyde dehydrogenase family protein [Frankia sp. CNm7]|uniref:Aldehyde dehydrogenase family protein n=1 Tax=Frankia nepalensis TaxID=1836974 RepID=A0A937UQX7_9ACTN|nr:aldehyde dehydrogenase family protein [Frankia nepalensis]MBL7500006.1 aldehyde dehydrogenase family protein [Frankia nepalensis]MBL7510648.1 aldehyde dehydrogenase family protein [Frankia nepalensis]MBL7520771.1 aldehyde dehydrogenase family protein [Frankia nepalensis]MBL7627181.1 aldehyde dehydrogenase family protein [Frankia nepalensis]
MTFAGLNVAKLLIDGRLVDAEGGATYENINPATEQSIGVAADASTGDVNAAIAAARRAFDETSWSTDVAFRVRCLRQLHDALAKHAEPFKAMMTAEVGLPTKMVGSTFDMPVENVGWVTDLLEKYEFTQDLGLGSIEGFGAHRWTEREPYGVVGAIVPWNQPLQVSLAKVAPALAAGNTVILKAPPTTPWCVSALGKLVAEHTDIPPGVFNIITSSVNDRGEELITDPRVDLISFTGSTAVGRRIMELGAQTVKKCFLELGGKSPNIVFEDADLRTGIGMSTFMVCLHGGQGCATLSRLLLPRSIFEQGVQMAAQMLSMMPYGDPLDPNNVMGPLNSARHRDRVEAMVERAKAAGGTPVVGGRRPPQLETGYYFEPTLFADLPEDAEIVQNEVFGPVLVVQAFEDEDDAVRIANNTIFGLSGAVFSGDHERSKRVARKVRAGTMIVDGGIYYGSDVPFGGYKQSGIGREMGQIGFEEYLQVKSLCEPA